VLEFAPARVCFDAGDLDGFTMECCRSARPDHGADGNAIDGVGIFLGQRWPRERAQAAGSVDSDNRTDGVRRKRLGAVTQ